MAKEDLTGQVFNYYTVLKDDGTKCSDGSTAWLCECICGTKKHIKGYDLKSGRRQSCGCMRLKTIGKKSQKDITNQKFNKLTALYPLNIKSGTTYLWHCKCECGNECDVSISNLTSGSVKSCGCLQKEKVSNLLTNLYNEERNSLINTTILGFLVEDAKSINGKTYIYAKCPYCETKKWFRLADIKNNISFQREYSFDSCRDKNPLPFDFYIDNKYIIEYDGIGHYEATDGWNTKERVEKTQEHDIIKNQWCFNNNIPIIRIPYTQYNNLCLKDLLLETTTFLVKENKNE